MKRLIFLFALLLISIAVICQPDSIPIPGSVIEIFADLKVWLGSTVGVAGVTIFLTILLTKVWKSLSKIGKQIAALVIALLLVIIGNIANIGFMAEFSALNTIVYGLMVGFIANGWYDLKNIAK